MTFSLFKKKLYYSIHSIAPLSASSCILGWYAFVVSVIEFDKEKWMFHVIVVGGLLFLLPWFITLMHRWLPSRIIIPTKTNDDHPLNGKVSLVISSIFEQKGDLILSYNRNNIAGGLVINEYNKPTLNLMGQFMHKYFPASKKESAQFDWSAFKACYDSPNTYIYYLNEQNKLVEFDKQAVPPHDVTNAKKATILLPKGSVIALKLPAGADREYAYLLCNTYYRPDQSMSAITNMDELEICLSTVWRVVSLLHPGGHNVCIPFLGKGYSGLTEHSYGVLWTIVFTYRKASSLYGVYNYGINICLPISILASNNLQIWEAARFMSYALRG